MRIVKEPLAMRSCTDLIGYVKFLTPRRFLSKGIPLQRIRNSAEKIRICGVASADMLPATYVNGRIEKIEAYPSKKDIRNWLTGVSFREPKKI